MSLFLEAYMELLRFEFYLRRSDFAALRNQIHQCRTRRETPPPPVEIEAVCHAVDRACIWYWKEVLCLQRSAATACLLRRRGAAAEMVVGTQQTPFMSHAWVELEGQVVNDKPYMQEIYAVLDRF
jgi:Transglutaminase-like superfamily